MTSPSFYCQRHWLQKKEINLNFSLTKIVGGKNHRISAVIENIQMLFP